MSQAILFTIATMLLSADCEALFFNDGHLEVEDPARNFSFDRNEVRNLRDFLNSSKVTDFLEQ